MLNTFNGSFYVLFPACVKGGIHWARGEDAGDDRVRLWPILKARRHRGCEDPHERRGLQPVTAGVEGSTKGREGGGVRGLGEGEELDREKEEAFCWVGYYEKVFNPMWGRMVHSFLIIKTKKSRLNILHQNSQTTFSFNNHTISEYC